ncbi:unnamed protein product [Linum trigynum]|uniref:Uncharacterized protein n=1 Tax=Linum trigynum TaxID=586398 RepID=A0AAV2DD45_9ROSI
MTRSNPAPLAPLDENINRTLRLLAQERELAEARSRSEERGQQVGPGVRGVEVEIEVEMAENQLQGGAAQPQNHNEGAAAEEAPKTMGYYMAPRPADIQPPSCIRLWPPTTLKLSQLL